MLILLNTVTVMRCNLLQMLRLLHRAHVLVQTGVLAGVVQQHLVYFQEAVAILYKHSVASAVMAGQALAA